MLYAGEILIICLALWVIIASLTSTAMITVISYSDMNCGIDIPILNH